jgi:hypothetical protein
VLLVGAALVVPLVTASFVPVASASPSYKQVPLPTVRTFKECPVNAIYGPPNGGVPVCVVGVANQGTIDIGTLDTTFQGPGEVDGAFHGLALPPSWADALDGQSFTAPPQLLSEPALALLGNPANVPPPANSRVYVVAEQAGQLAFSVTITSGIVTTLSVPLKFHIENPVVGPNCYIGTDASPVTLTLTTGTSGPLTGTLGSIRGFSFGSTSAGLQTLGTEVVDGQFSTPGATGCGTEGYWDSAIDSTNSLPSPSGANRAVLYGNFDLANAHIVKRKLHE